MIPDNVEKIIMTKEDYDRNVEQLLRDKCDAELRIDKAIYEIKFEWEEILKIPRYDLHLHTVDGLVIKRILNILEGKDE